jgi:hypothetical protein
VNGPTGTKKPAGVGGLVVWIPANGKLSQIGIPEIAHDKPTLEVLACCRVNMGESEITMLRF